MSGPNVWNIRVRMSGKVRRVMLEVIADLNSRNNMSSTSINWRKLPREAVELEKGDDRPIQQIVLEDAMSEIVEEDGSWSGSVRSLKEVIIDKLDDIMDHYLKDPCASPATGNTTPSTRSASSSAASSPRISPTATLEPEPSSGGS